MGTEADCTVDPTVSVHDVRRIVSKPGADPIAAARKARASGSLADLETAATDRTASPRARAIALLAAAEHCAVAGLDLPEALLGALEDPSVVAAALAARIPQALTGALAAAPDDPVTQATRKLIAARLVSEDIAGTGVAMLLLAAGSDAQAARMLAAEFLDNINDFEQAARPESAVWAVVVGQLARERPEAFSELCTRIAAESLASIEVLAELIGACDGLSESDKALARAAIERAHLLATI